MKERNKVVVHWPAFTVIASMNCSLQEEVPTTKDKLAFFNNLSTTLWIEGRKKKNQSWERKKNSKASRNFQLNWTKHVTTVYKMIFLYIDALHSYCEKWICQLEFRFWKRLTFFYIALMNSTIPPLTMISLVFLHINHGWLFNA